MLKKVLVAVIILVGVFVLLLYPKVYVLRGSAGGSLYWNASEALLFMSGGSSGARMSYLRYELEPFAVGMGHTRPPDDERCTGTLVIQITDKDVRSFDTNLYRYAQEPYCGMGTAVFQGRIYEGYLAEGKIWRWSGTQFELPAPEDLRGFDAGRYAAALGSHPWEFDNIDGWSMRALGSTTPRSQMVLNGQPVTIIFHGETWPPAPVSVDLIRPGQSPQTIWTFDGRPHRVSKSEYERLFPPSR